MHVSASTKGSQQFKLWTVKKCMRRSQRENTADTGRSEALTQLRNIRVISELQ